MFRGTPIICLVTDMSRLPSATADELERLVRHAANAGVDLIQLRERHLADRDLLALATRLVSAVGQTTARLVLNDRVDVALAAGAAGVHLRADSFDAGRVRAIAPADFLIGRSVHAEGEAREAAATGVDYLIYGTVFRTRSKPDLEEPHGIAGLAAVCRRVTVPVLAIGGIASDNVGDLAAAGAAGVAAIGLFTETLNDQRHADIDAALDRLVGDIRRGFNPH
jgi:thiamine-phosphate pyrophosphorylase